MIIFPFQHYFFFFLELISVAFRLLSLYIYHEVIPKASPSSVNFLTFYQCHHLQEVFPVAPSLLLLRSAGHLSLSMPGSSVVLSLGSGAFFLPHPQLVYAIILHSSPLSRKGHLFWVLILEGLVRLHRAIQLQLLRHYWLGHRLGLLCYTPTCLCVHLGIVIFWPSGPLVKPWCLSCFILPWTPCLVIWCPLPRLPPLHYVLFPGIFALKLFQVQLWENMLSVSIRINLSLRLLSTMCLIHLN